MQAIFEGVRAIRLGEAQVVLAGGTESMSRVPYMLDARWGLRMGHRRIEDGMYRDGFHDPLSDQLMGRTAETLAEKYEIPRDEQDAFALASQQKAGKAMAEGAFNDEIVPVRIDDETVVDTDEHARPNTSLEKLAKLPPVFKKGGTVHAGNSSGITDGAAALLVMSESYAKEKGVEILAVFEDYASAGVDPKIMGIAPVPATNNLLARTGLALDDFDLIELNEAFAAQVLACKRELDYDPARLNVHGGSIALGHPIGCTGARIVVTLLHAMKRRGVERGLATLCISGGQGFAGSFLRA